VGRVGILVMQTSTGKLLTEQVVSAGPHAVLAEATLCDRPSREITLDTVRNKSRDST
jgi:hypothetical protein